MSGSNHDGDASEPAPRPVHRGRHFEDYTVGEELATPARTVTEGEIALFAGLSWDTNPLHTDESFARRTPFRKRIAHGMLLQSIASGLAAQTGIFDGTIAAFESCQARFRRPVFAGDTIHVVLRVAELDPEPTRRRGWVRLALDMYNQEDACVIQGEWRLLVLRRTPARRDASTKTS